MQCSPYHSSIGKQVFGTTATLTYHVRRYIAIRIYPCMPILEVYQGYMPVQNKEGFIFVQKEGLL